MIKAIKICFALICFTILVWMFLCPWLEIALTTKEVYATCQTLVRKEPLTKYGTGEMLTAIVDTLERGEKALLMKERMDKDGMMVYKIYTPKSEIGYVFDYDAVIIKERE